MRRGRNARAACYGVTGRPSTPFQLGRDAQAVTLASAPRALFTVGEVHLDQVPDEASTFVVDTGLASAEGAMAALFGSIRLFHWTQSPIVEGSTHLLVCCTVGGTRLYRPDASQAPLHRAKARHAPTSVPSPVGSVAALLALLGILGGAPTFWTESRSARCPSQDSTVWHLPALSLNRSRHLGWFWPCRGVPGPIFVLD